jgi:hypothetical protein
LEELEGRILLSAPALAAAGPPALAPARPAPAVYVVGPTVDPTTTSPAAEETIAVDPSSAQNLFAAVIDFGSGRTVGGISGLSTTKVAVSSDNGATWVDSYIPIDTNPFSLGYGLLPTADGLFWDWNGDPAVAVDKRGNAYLASIYSDKVTRGVHASNSLYVGVQSLAALATTGFRAAAMYPVEVNLGEARQQADKDWIAVDNSCSPYTGTVYVSWTEDDSSHQQRIEVSRSTDQGRTWSPPVTVSRVSHNRSVTGSQVAVGPDGEVYVAWLTTPSRTSHLVGGPGRIFLAKSADGGLTFSAPAAITPVFGEPDFPALYQKNSFPSLAVSPTNGNVYVAYADQPSAAASARVELVRSTQGGKRFSPPAPVDDASTGQQLLPAIAVDGSGVIHASWLDTRNGKSPLNTVFDVYAASSTNDGASFGPAVRVTPASIHVGAALFVGDYTGIAAAGGFAHPVWSNGSVGLGPDAPGIGSLLTGSDHSRLQTAALALPEDQPIVRAATAAGPASTRTARPSAAATPSAGGASGGPEAGLAHKEESPPSATASGPGGSPVRGMAAVRSSGSTEGPPPQSPQGLGGPLVTLALTVAQPLLQWPVAAPVGTGASQGLAGGFRTDLGVSGAGPGLQGFSQALVSGRTGGPILETFAGLPVQVRHPVLPTGRLLVRALGLPEYQEGLGEVRLNRLPLLTSLAAQGRLARASAAQHGIDWRGAVLVTGLCLYLALGLRRRAPLRVAAGVECDHRGGRSPEAYRDEGRRRLPPGPPPRAVAERCWPGPAGLRRRKRRRSARRAAAAG